MRTGCRFARSSQLFLLPPGNMWKLKFFVGGRRRDPPEWRGVVSINLGYSEACVCLYMCTARVSACQRWFVFIFRLAFLATLALVEWKLQLINEETYSSLSFVYFLLPLNWLHFPTERDEVKIKQNIFAESCRRRRSDWWRKQLNALPARFLHCVWQAASKQTAKTSQFRHL